MGASCCDSKSPALEKMAAQQKKVLWTVLLINLVMFGVELVSGLYANSLALLGDSLDMLGDTLAYGASLYVIHLSRTAKARSAMFKGWIILISAVAVLGAAIYRTFYQDLPLYEVMGVVGSIALGANLVCLALLTRYRNTDINMKSVWLCSRNDIIANLSVLAAAGLVNLTGTPWPDLIVGISLALLFLKSALHIFSVSRQEIAMEKSINAKQGCCP